MIMTDYAQKSPKTLATTCNNTPWCTLSNVVLLMLQGLLAMV